MYWGNEFAPVVQPVKSLVSKLPFVIRLTNAFAFVAKNAATPRKPAPKMPESFITLAPGSLANSTHVKIQYRVFWRVCQDDVP